MSINLESTLVGVAGEYLVGGELSLRGFTASITLRNSRGIDIIAGNNDASKTVSIQVKTNSNGKPSWLLNKKSETLFSDNHYYIFVAVSSVGQRPDFHIVPSTIVAEFISRSHAEWLSEPKRDGSGRKDTPLRRFVDHDGAYKERWDILSL